MGFVAEVPLKTRRGVLVLCAIGWVAPAINGRSSGRINKERLRQPRDVFLAKVAKIADAFSLFSSIVFYTFFVAKGRNFWVGWVNASRGLRQDHFGEEVGLPAQTAATCAADTRHAVRSYAADCIRAAITTEFPAMYVYFVIAFPAVWHRRNVPNCMLFSDSEKMTSARSRRPLSSFCVLTRFWTPPRLS